MQFTNARHRYAGPSHRSEPCERGRRPRNVLLASAVSVLVVSSVALNASARTPVSSKATHQAAAQSKIFFGVVGDQTLAKVSPPATIGHHEYGQLGATVPVGRMITMGTSGLSYNAVTAAGPGSATYNNIARWADTIKARGGTILFAFAHEPEARKHGQFGGPASFIAADRHVVDIFRSRGVNNVVYVWQMTDWAFSPFASSSQRASQWYPGDGYVDAVGPDAYNWYNCGPGHGRWHDVNLPAAAALAFARAHGKKLVLAEFGSQTGPLRAQWLSNAAKWFIANKNTIIAAFYFDRPATVANTGCIFPLSSHADVNALATIADNTAEFTG